MRKPWRCSLCGKRFTSPQGVSRHLVDFHKGKPGSAEKVPPRPKDDDEESFADRAIQASEDRAAGIPNADADWLLP